MTSDRRNDQRPAVGVETESERQCQHDAALDGGDGRAAERAAEHDRDARDRRHQRLLQETELPVPDDLMPVNIAVKIMVMPMMPGARNWISFLPGCLEDATEAVAEREQVKERLAERADDARPRRGNSSPRAAT